MDYEEAMDPTTMVSKRLAVLTLEEHDTTLDVYESELGQMPDLVKTADILIFLGY